MPDQRRKQWKRWRQRRGEDSKGEAVEEKVRDLRGESGQEKKKKLLSGAGVLF